jgi:hypothetical protein
MKSLLKRSSLLLGLITCVSGYPVLPALADSTADLVLSLKCQGDYTVDIWQRQGSDELLYRATGPLGNLSLGNGTREDTGAAQVYQFENDIYKYQVLGGKGDHQSQGTLEVFRNDRSILSQACSKEG